MSCGSRLVVRADTMPSASEAGGRLSALARVHRAREASPSNYRTRGDPVSADHNRPSSLMASRQDGERYALLEFPDLPARNHGCREGRRTLSSLAGP